MASREASLLSSSYTSPNDIVSDRGRRGFFCNAAGETSKTMLFDPLGFVVSGEGKVHDTLICGLDVQQSQVSVFQEEFDIDGIVVDDLKRLFKIARNRLCLMDSIPKGNSGSSRTDSCNSSDVMDFNKIRQEIREFYIFLRVFVSIEGNHPESYWLLHQTLPTIMKGLSLLRTQLGWLTDLHINVWNNIHSKCSSKPTAQAAFHLFHCHLELRWLHVSVLWSLASWDVKRRLNECQLSENGQSFPSNCDFQALLMEAIQLCVVDIIQMEIAKFNKINTENIVQTTAHNCVCVKELWLLLRLVSENYVQQGTKKSFWKVVDNLFELFVENEDSSTCLLKKASRPLEVPSKILCSDICALWLLKHIAEIFGYSNIGETLNPLEHEIDSNYIILKRVLNNLTGPSIRLKEPERRVLVTIVWSLVFDLWRPKPEPIMMLWESFYRTLDDTFTLPGAPTSSYVVVSETILDILQPLKSKSGRNVNSYDMFLSMLGTYLKQDPKQWKLKMQGRFFSKLSEKKVNSLSELGLYHLTQLFLTIALQTDLEELCSQFQKFVKFNENDDKRSIMVTKAHLCFIFLLAENGKTLEPSIGSLTNFVRDCSMKRHSVVAKIFVENLEYVIKAHDDLMPDFHVLIGEWIWQYLHHQDNIRNMLNVMIVLFQKIEKHIHSNIVGGTVKKLVAALREYLLPYVKEHINTDVPQIADLAVYFTLLALDFNSSCPKQFSKQDSFKNLLTYFLTSDSSHVIFIRRYLYCILSHSRISSISEIMDMQVIFVQAWIRCCALECLDQEQDKCITEKIMPFLQNIFEVPAHFSEGLQNSSDPLLELIKFLGNYPRKTVEKLIDPLKRIVSQMQSTLGLVKVKEGSWKSEKVKSKLKENMVVRAFFVLGTLTFECAGIIHQKNTSGGFLSFIMSTLIIPPVVFDMEKILPLCMTEGLCKSLLLFLFGLHKLDPEKEKCIQRFLHNIIQCYVPRFRVNASTDPFLRLWDQPEHMPAATKILEAICDILLQIDRRTNLPCKHYVQGLTLFCDLIKRHSNDELLLIIMINKAFPNMLEVVGRVTDINASSKKKETEKALYIMFKAEAYQYPNLWKETNTVLSLLSEKYLSFNSDILMSMLSFLIKDFKEIVRRFLPYLKDQITKVISKRGSGSDRKLELNFTNLKEAVNS